MATNAFVNKSNNVSTYRRNDRLTTDQIDEGNFVVIKARGIEVKDKVNRGLYTFVCRCPLFCDEAVTAC